ncbi:MAG: tetratricopeptide repeat protein [Pseudomonadota bacterium]|jgi:tetratricopeptide (TPR) repeat protein
MRAFGVVLVAAGFGAGFAHAQDLAACRADAPPAAQVSACNAALTANTAARVELLLGRAAAYRKAQQRDQAIADYTEAMRLQLPSARILFARGQTYREAGDRRRALADYDAALKLDPALEPLRAARKTLFEEIERAGAMMPVQQK